MKSVIIIDDDEIYSVKLADYVEKSDEFKVVAIAISGRDGKLLIEHYKPDVIIMDIILLDDDGLNVIKHIYNSYDNYKPYLFVITSISTSSMEKMLLELGVDFVEFKPLEYKNLNNILNKISSDIEKTEKRYITNTSKKDITDFIVETLAEMRMSQELLGYVCVKTALYFILDNLDARPHIYKKVSEILSISEKSADKNIRTASNTCVGSELYCDLFGKHPVNNLRFLYGTAIYIEMRMRGSEKNDSGYS
ncbi:MAG: response regulator [Defluviitaleaceae bacterium]|nr:response regulator [Defluviitaleaceae bacterium]